MLTFAASCGRGDGSREEGGQTHDNLRVAEGLRQRVAQLTTLLFRGPESVRLSMSQAAVLGRLRNGPALRMSDLAESERVSQPSMTNLVSRMERHGWVVRVADPSDRRVVKVSITREGATLLRRAARDRSRVLARRVAALSAADQAALAAALPALDALIQQLHETNDLGNADRQVDVERMDVEQMQTRPDQARRGDAE